LREIDSVWLVEGKRSQEKKEVKTLGSGSIILRGVFAKKISEEVAKK